MSIASCFENRIRKIERFELGKEIEKDVFRLFKGVRLISSLIISR